MIGNSKVNSKRGTALILGMFIVLIISGVVIAQHQLMVASAGNIESFSNHQSALYTSHSGIVRSQHLLTSNGEVTINEVTDNFLNHVDQVGDSYSFQGTSGDGDYYVTITRLSAEDAVPQDLNPEQFEIVDNSIIPSVDYDADFKVLGAEWGYSNGVGVPITADIQVGDVWQSPWGDPDDPVTSNLNDDWAALNSDEYVVEGVAADTPINFMLKAWSLANGYDYPEQVEVYSTVYSEDEANEADPQMLVLRNGDIPQQFDSNYPNQSEVGELIADYVDPETGMMVLDDNQVIYLTDVNSYSSPSSWDMQDAVVLVTLQETGGSSEAPSEDVGYTAVSKNNGKAVMYQNPTEPLGSDGAQKTDTFEMTVTGGSGEVTVSTWIDGVRINTTMNGEVGETVVDSQGFEITIVAIEGNTYTISVSSVSNSGPLQKVKFHYGTGATVTASTTVVRTDYLTEESSSSLGYFEVVSTGYQNGKKYTFKGVISLVEDLSYPDSGRPLLIQRRPITNTDEETTHLENFTGLSSNY